MVVVLRSRLPSWRWLWVGKNAGVPVVEAEEPHAASIDHMPLRGQESGRGLTKRNGLHPRQGLRRNWVCEMSGRESVKIGINDEGCTAPLLMTRLVFH